MSSLVAGVCKKCYKKFYRDGDLMSFSTSFATPFVKTNLTIDNISTYKEWLMLGGEYCDYCLPPMPEKIKKDIERENKRRSDAMIEHLEIKKEYLIPKHESKYRERFFDNENNSIDRTSKQRERDLRRKNKWRIKNITVGDW